MMYSFWWGHSGTQNKGIHWMSWDKLSMHKNEAGNRWCIGDGTNIPVWNENWLHDGSCLAPTADTTSMLNHLCVADLIHPDDKAWNIPLITSFFDTTNANKIINTALFPSVTEGKLIWRVDPHGHYSVKSAYRLCTQELIDTSLLSRPGMWHLIWKLHSLPKVKKFLWRVCPNCLPTRVRLRDRVLWSIWKQRNNKIWNNTIDAQSSVLARAEEMLKDWTAVWHVYNRTTVVMQSATVSTWKKPLPDRFKCNIDASFEGTKVGIGMCVRDEAGAFISAKTECFFSPRFSSSRPDATEFGDIIKNCKSCLSHFYNDSSVEFIRRQANEVAHNLAKVALFSASSQVLVDIPHCIEHILLNEML
ncbi:hypothetical protein P8452_77124 [Trifolium repens]|nr:hypothetical protein P8452_77124 [Trifolium repens]